MMYFIHGLLMTTVGYSMCVLGYVYGVIKSGFEAGMCLSKKHENKILDYFENKQKS